MAKFKSWLILGILFESVTTHTVSALDTDLRLFSGTWIEDTSKSTVPVDPEATLSYRQNADGSLTQTQTFGPDKQEMAIWVDGKSHQIESRPGMTQIWIHKGSSAWERKVSKDGKLAYVTLREIGPNGHTMTETETDYSQNSTSTQSITIYQRTTNTTGLVGRWKPTSARDVTPDLMEMSFGSDGTLNWHGFALDYRFSAKFDGKDYPVTGPVVNPKLREALIKVDDRTFQDITKNGEKPFQVGIWRLFPDGNTMCVTYVDLRSSIPLTRNLVYHRQ